MQPVQYTTRSFMTSSFAVGVAMVTFLSLGVMGTLIMIGAPTLVTLALFIGSTYLGVMWIGGEAVYRMDDQGLERMVTSLLTKRTRRQHFAWEMVESFKSGRDLDRSWDEYDFLEIQFRRGGHSWKLANQSDPAAFATFQQAFQLQVEQQNLSCGDGTIRHRRSFFETAFAKLVTHISYLFLIGLALVYLARPGLLEFRHLLRLLLVILPGVAYLTYRVYLKPDKPAP